MQPTRFVSVTVLYSIFIIVIIIIDSVTNKPPFVYCSQLILLSLYILFVLAMHYILCRF